MSVTHWLPTEIWRLIFQLATAEGRGIYETEYIPFQSSNFSPSRSPTTAISLSRVSKQWQALAAEFLFQRVWVRHGVRGLLESLKGSMQSEGYGRYVRRLELPSTPMTHDAANRVRLVDILACCPRLQIIVQPTFYASKVGDLGYWFDPIPAEQPQINDSDVVLTSLKFLHWSTYGLGGEAIKASLSLLSNIIVCSPNLCYLSVSWPTSIREPILQDVDRTSHPVLLPSLKTLNFERNSGLSHRDIQNGDLPNLIHLTLNPVSLFNVFSVRSPLHMVGPQLCTVELHKSVRGTRLDVNPFFKLCSKLQEFAYHVGFPRLRPPHLLQHSELKTVRMQIESIDHLTALSGEQYEMYDGVDLSWTMLDEAFAFFSAYAFPALQLIILHGDWDSVVHDGQFRSLRQLVLDRGCSLEYPDGTPVR